MPDSTKFYEPTNDDSVRQSLVDARARVKELDEIDGCPVTAYDLDLGLRTCISAMLAGAKAGIVDGVLGEPVLDGIVMLQQIEASVRLRHGYSIQGESVGIETSVDKMNKRKAGLLQRGKE